MISLATFLFALPSPQYSAEPATFINEQQYVPQHAPEPANNAPAYGDSPYGNIYQQNY